MGKIRLSELYTSVQGEGPNVGKPTTFVRFGGCNMRCPGWPCDTEYAIDPEKYRHEWHPVTPVQTYEQVKAFYPQHVCVTGGEPLLQPKAEVDEFFGLLTDNKYTIDLFTNGSFKFDDYHILLPNVTIIMDWKLVGSGENDTKLQERWANLGLLREQDALKFVVKDDTDFTDAFEMVKELGKTPFRIYFGVAWDELDEADLIKELEYHKLSNVYVNVQVHKYIFDPKQRGI